MSESLAELESRWLRSRDPSDEIPLLAARVRSGLLTEQQLRLAAYLESEAARVVLQSMFPVADLSELKSSLETGLEEARDKAWRFALRRGLPNQRRLVAALAADEFVRGFIPNLRQDQIEIFQFTDCLRIEAMPFCRVFFRGSLGNETSFEYRFFRSGGQFLRLTNHEDGIAEAIRKSCPDGPLRCWVGDRFQLHRVFLEGNRVVRPWWSCDRLDFFYQFGEETVLRVMLALIGALNKKEKSALVARTFSITRDYIFSKCPPKPADVNEMTSDLFRRSGHFGSSIVCLEDCPAIKSILENYALYSLGAILSRWFARDRLNPQTFWGYHGVSIRHIAWAAIGRSLIPWALGHGDPLKTADPGYPSS